MRAEAATTEDRSAGVTISAPWRVREVRVLPEYRLAVSFLDGTEGTVDMKGLIESETAGVFSTLRNPAVFGQAHVEYGAVTWPGEIDVAPDAMYEAIREKGNWVITTSSPL